MISATAEFGINRLSELKGSSIQRTDVDLSLMAEPFTGRPVRIE